MGETKSSQNHQAGIMRNSDESGAWLDISNLTEDQRDEFEERAAIMQFDAGMTKERAEQEALKLVMNHENNPETD